MRDQRSRLYELFPHGTGNFLRRDVLHILTAAVKVDAGIFALTLGDDLHFETAFFAAEHIARGGILGVGVTHGWLPWCENCKETVGTSPTARLKCTLYAERIAARNSVSVSCRPSRTISNVSGGSGQPKQASKQSN
jgi:hypothetical protein